MFEALALGLGGFLLVVGATHFVVPDYYVRLVPPWLPGPRVLAFVSGAVEIVIGAALLAEPTRIVAGWAATALMTTYVLTHVDALVRASPDARSWLDRPAGAVVRVIVNVGYLVWAATVALTA